MTAFRILGAGLVILGAASAGLSEVFSMSRRIETLSGFISALEVMESEIYFNLTPLYDICEKLRKAARAPLVPFFTALSKGAGGERSFSENWREALEKSRLSLKSEERQVIRDLSNTVGRYDIEAQVKAIAYTRRRLEGFLKEAVLVKSKMGRVYGTLGFAAGAAVVIILF